VSVRAAESGWRFDRCLEAFPWAPVVDVVWRPSCWPTAAASLTGRESLLLRREQAGAVSALHVADRSTLREQATEFTADETPIGPVAIRATSHVTYRDLRRRLRAAGPHAGRAIRAPADVRGPARARACPCSALASKRDTHWCRSPRTRRS